MDKGAVETVLGAVLAFVAGTGYVNVTVLHFNVDVGIYFLLEAAVFAFYGYYVVFNLDRNAGRDCDGSFTYT